MSRLLAGMAPDSEEAESQELDELADDAEESEGNPGPSKSSTAAGADTRTVTIEVVKGFLAKHGRGPRGAELAKLLGATETAATQRLRKLRNEGVLVWDGRDLTTLRVVSGKAKAPAAKPKRPFAEEFTARVTGKAKKAAKPRRTSKAKPKASKQVAPKTARPEIIDPAPVPIIRSPERKPVTGARAEAARSLRQALGAIEAERDAILSVLEMLES